MMNYISLIAFLMCFQLNAQTVNFQQAYATYPDIPEGILEAVSWAKTRMRHLDENVPESCAGLPKAYGIMGLIEDGKDYFIETGHLVGSFSSSDWAAIKQDVNLEVLAYANAFNHYFQLEEGSEAQRIYGALFELSEIPTNGLENMYAKESSIYEIFQFLRNETFANQHGFIAKSYDLKNVFGENNLKVLSASRIQMTTSSILTELGQSFAPSTLKSDEYDPAIWDPAPSCNYSSRSGTAISAITIHTIQGTYAGAISWAKNCNSNVSYHYVVRSSDGQVTQMVMEADKAWHVGSANPYTIGYEHDGYVDDPAWYTDELYNSSAAISRDIVNSGYGIPPLRTYYGPSSSGTNTLGNCTKIKGHQHYPNQTHTDPGINWDWERYYKLINNDPSYTLYSDPSGQLFDSGGEFNNY